MATLTLKQTNHSAGQPVSYSGVELVIDMEKLIGHSTGSLKIKKGTVTGSLFISDNNRYVCSIRQDTEMRVDEKRFERYRQYAIKANAVVSFLNPAEF